MPPSRNAGVNRVTMIRATRSNAGQVRSGRDLVKVSFVSAISMILAAKYFLARIKGRPPSPPLVRRRREKSRNRLLNVIGRPLALPNSAGERSGSRGELALPVVR